MSDNGILSGLTKLVAEVGKVPIKSVHIVIRDARDLPYSFAGAPMPEWIPAGGGRTRFGSVAMTPVSARVASRILPLVLAAGLLAACETTGAGVATEPPKPPEPPMTHTRAAEQCWMATEKGAASLSLDKRADLVDKCIADKMKTASGTAEPAPAPEAKKPEAKKKKPAAAEAKKKKPAEAAGEKKGDKTDKDKKDQTPDAADKKP